MADIYLLADVEYSHEGLEGIVGYLPFASYVNVETAKSHAVALILRKDGKQPEFKYEWRDTPEESAEEILYYSYKGHYESEYCAILNVTLFEEADIDALERQVYGG